MGSAEKLLSSQVYPKQASFSGKQEKNQAVNPDCDYVNRQFYSLCHTPMDFIEALKNKIEFKLRSV